MWHRDGLRVLAVGRLSYQGVSRPIEGAQRSARELVINGKGEEPRASSECLKRRTRRGFALAGCRRRPSRLMAPCDVLCSLARATEAFVPVLLEAMRYGKPLVVSDSK